MVKWMSNSLGRKLSVIIMISTLVPLLSLGVFTYSVSSIVTEEKVNQSGIATLKQMEDKLRFIIDDIENISLFMIGQNDIQKFLSAEVDDNQHQARILDFMMNLSTSKKYISNISLYSKNANTTLSNTAIYSSNLSDQVDLYNVTDKIWTGVYTVS
ncbi:MAG TPA: sensor histidine kinase, partial [Candidatus Paenibacillus intestinavium]|nr:sensor histidine kinase [Candidatus Paenibacillus intestinavium]